MPELRVLPTLLGLAALVTYTGCDAAENLPEVRSDQPHQQHPQIDASEAETLAADNRELSFDLYHALREGEAANQGFAISGYSIRSAFGMLYGGTVDPARAQMTAALHFSLGDPREHVAANWLDAELSARKLPANDNAAAVELRSANGVWLLADFAEQISSDYLDLLAIHYDAGVHLARFDTQPEVERAALNAWVAEHTVNLIPALFPVGSITKDTAMVLVNAVYLEAPWAHPFDADATKPAPFFRLDGSQTEVAMMHEFALSADYGEGPGYQAIALPLRGEALELLIIVPDDFQGFEAQLDAERFIALREAMQPAIVTTSLPKFELEAKLELTDELQGFGMLAPFFDDHSFDAIVERLGVITTVMHQAVIKVDELGVEAAAATGVVITLTSAPIPSAQIVVDRPFLLAIRDAPTGTLLFLGRVLDPGVV